MAISGPARGPRVTAPDPGPVFDLASDDLQQCIRCGMCLEACPTYQLTGLETESPRGRIHLMDALVRGRIEPTERVTLHLDRCLGCRACEAVCPSGVPYGRLIEGARAGLDRLERDRGERHAVRDLLLRQVLARPAVLDVFARVASLYERTGLRRALRASGLLRLLPRGLRRLESLYPPFARPRYRPPAGAAPGSRRGAGAKGRAPGGQERVALLLGCVMRVAYGDVHTATARVLSRLGALVVDVPDQACCGALHAHAGDRTTARELARRATLAFERSEIDVIVVDAAGCGAHMKHYVDLFTDDPIWRERAQALAQKVRDATEYIASLDLPASFGRVPLRVTYQDPCHLAHAQRIREQPRALLRRVEGLELVEMAGADVCCGSAGTYNLTQPDYADALQAAKVTAVLATRPDAVVTANPGCMLQIEAGLRDRGSPIPVLHVVELLDRAWSSQGSSAPSAARR